jgi:4-hydroxy-tetrahydrodipicolinate reductase
MATKSDPKPRVVLYGTGHFGQRVTRFAVEKGWTIVAAFNRAGNKVGQDLGRLAGLGVDLGVVVQDCERASFEGIEAEIGIVGITDRLSLNLTAYKRLMNAGLNVICHGAEAYYPQGIDPVLAREIDAVARRNNVTFTGAKIWDHTRTWPGILLAGPCTEIRSFFHRSITDAQQVGKPAMLKTGVGMTPGEYDERIVKSEGQIGGFYKVIPHNLLAALGYTVTSVTERREPVLFSEPIYCRLLERIVAPGTCAGTRIVIDVETREGVTATAHIELRLIRDNEQPHMMWSVEGKPAAKIIVERENEDAAYGTLSCLFNRIPDVIAAPAGIQDVSRLGVMKHSALGWRGAAADRA